MVRLLVLAVVVASALVGAGCAGETDPETARDEMALRPEIRPGVRLDRLLAAQGDAAPVLGVMRAPRSQRAAPVANRHVEGQVDTVVTWTYDGLELETYEVAGGPTLIRRVVVTEATYGTADGLSVGETRASLEAVLGPAEAEAAEVASYRVDAGAMPVTVDVTYAPDDDGVERATRIDWRLPVD